MTSSDLDKHFANLMNNLSRKPPTHPRRLPSPLQPNDRSKQVQEAQPKKNLPKMHPSSSAPTTNNGKLPFVEQPVSSTLGSPAYGDHLQHNNKISYDLWLGGPVEETKYRREEIYELSSVADMITAFLDDDLF